MLDFVADLMKAWASESIHEFTAPVLVLGIIALTVRLALRHYY